MTDSPYRLKRILMFLMLLAPLFAFAETEDNMTELPPIVVQARRLENKPRASLSGFLLRGGTGNAGDPIRGIAQLPSAGVLNDFVGVLSVRGGGPEDNLYYFDRLPLGYPYHLLGIISTVNAEVIENVDVYPGGYGAEFGVNSQAVIDIHSRTQTDIGFGGNVNLNPVYSQAFLEGHLGERGYWYAFGRRSYMGPLFELLPKLLKTESDLVTEVPSFWSYQGKMVYQLNGPILNKNEVPDSESQTIHKFVINAIAADDSSELNFGKNEVNEGDLRGPVRSDNPFDSQGMHLYSEKAETFKSVLSLTRSFSRTELEFGEGYFYRSSQSVYSLRGDVAYWIKYPYTGLETGFDLSNVPSTLISNGARPIEEGDQDYDFRLKQDGEKIYTALSKNLHRLEGYLQATQNFSAFLYATAGVRMTYAELTDNFLIQPRALLGVTLGPKLADLRFMYGKYAQTPRFYQVVLGEENPEIAPSLATHYIMALEKDLTPETKMEFAWYYKNLQDMITFNLSEKRYQNQRTGSVKGVEVSLEHTIGDVFRAWLAYSYTLSKRRDSDRDDERLYMYNTPHALTLNLNYIAASWEVGANWQYKSGVLYSPLIKRERYTNPFTKNQTWIGVYGEPRHTIPYHRLDLRFHWHAFSLNQWGLGRLGLTFELWNVYNRNNLLQVRYDANFTKHIPVSQLRIVPFLAVTLEF